MHFREILSYKVHFILFCAILEIDGFIYLFICLFIEIHQHVQNKYKNIQQAFNLTYSTNDNDAIALTETVGREDTSDARAIGDCVTCQNCCKMTLCRHTELKYETDQMQRFADTPS